MEPVFLEYVKIRNISYVEKDIPRDAQVEVQVKYDGSNVAVRKHEGSLILQSRTQFIDIQAPGMFKPFVDWVSEHVEQLNANLIDGAIAYGEMLSNQGKIKYPQKVPFVLFDFGLIKKHPNPNHPQPDSFDARYMSFFPPFDNDAARFGSSVVDTWWRGAYKDLPLETLKARLTDEHEGFVIKAYDVTTRWQNPETGESGEHFYPLLAGKVVREDYQELKTGKTAMKKVDDPLAEIADRVVTLPRVRKAVMRVLEEGGDYTKPHLVISKVAKDTHDENADDVKEWLWKAYWPKMHSLFAKKALELHAQVLDEMRVS